MNYQAPELLELGNATDLTLGTCNTCEDDSCTDCKKGPNGGGDLLA